MAHIISGLTKKGQALRASALRWEGTELSDVYGRYSNLKEKAMRQCREWCEADGGWDFHIISHTCQGFSVAWYYSDKETGEIITRIETPFSTYRIDSTRRKENN